MNDWLASEFPSMGLTRRTAGSAASNTPAETPASTRPRPRPRRQTTADVKHIGMQDRTSGSEVIGGLTRLNFAQWVLIPALLLHLIQEDEALRLGNVHQPTFAAALEMARSTSSLGILLYPEEQYEGDREPTPEQVVKFWYDREDKEHDLFDTPPPGGGT